MYVDGCLASARQQQRPQTKAVATDKKNNKKNYNNYYKLATATGLAD